MPSVRVSAWALLALLVCLWSLYNRRIAIERRRRMEEDRPSPHDPDDREG